MKRITNSFITKPTAAPSFVIFYISCIIVTIMLISGIIALLLPSDICHATLAMEYIRDLSEALSRVIALSAIFITLASVLDAKYPRKD